MIFCFFIFIIIFYGADSYTRIFYTSPGDHAFIPGNGTYGNIYLIGPGGYESNLLGIATDGPAYSISTMDFKSINKIEISIANYIDSGGMVAKKCVTNNTKIYNSVRFGNTYISVGSGFYYTCLDSNCNTYNLCGSNDYYAANAPRQSYGIFGDKLIITKNPPGYISPFTNKIIATIPYYYSNLAGNYIQCDQFPGGIGHIYGKEPCPGAVVIDLYP